MSSMTQCKRLAGISTSTSAFIAVLALVVLCALAVSAQSGRRAPKSAPAPPPEPSPVPAQTKPAEKPGPAYSFVIGIDRDLSFVSIPTYFSESVLRACAERLDDYPSVKVDVAPRDVNRGEAAKRAKAEKEAYVVLLNLRSDSMNSDGSNSYSDIYLEYVVFTPTTAKIATSGRTYQRSFRSGGVIGLPRTSGATSEYALKEAGREAAERIFAAIRNHASGDRVPG